MNREPLAATVDMAILLSALEGGYPWDFLRLAQDTLSLLRTVHVRFGCQPLCSTDGMSIAAVPRHRFVISVGWTLPWIFGALVHYRLFFMNRRSLA